MIKLDILYVIGDTKSEIYHFRHYTGWCSCFCPLLQQGVDDILMHNSMSL